MIMTTITLNYNNHSILLKRTALNATQNLKYDHITIRRIKNIAQTCSNKLYANKHVPIEDIETISVIIEEFVDHFHHGKEENAYFPDTKEKNGFSEDIRKFLIEHELGRRIAMMLRRELKEWKEKLKEENRNNSMLQEPVARFLKSYTVFIDDHTGKEDKFFDMVEEKKVITDNEDKIMLDHYELCKNQAGGEARIQEMIRLIEYLEEREWMKE
jgi:hemerythrin-like domain-containing protein